MKMIYDTPHNNFNTLISQKQILFVVQGDENNDNDLKQDGDTEVRINESFFTAWNRHLQKITTTNIAIEHSYCKNRGNYILSTGVYLTWNILLAYKDKCKNYTILNLWIEVLKV